MFTDLTEGLDVFLSMKLCHGREICLFHSQNIVGFHWWILKYDLSLANKRVIFVLNRSGSPLPIMIGHQGRQLDGLSAKSVVAVFGDIVTSMFRYLVSHCSSEPLKLFPVSDFIFCNYSFFKGTLKIKTGFSSAQTQVSLYHRTN